MELTAGLGGCSSSPCSWRWAAVSPQRTPQTAAWKLSPSLWWSRWGARTHRAAHKGQKREQSVSNPQPSRPKGSTSKNKLHNYNLGLMLTPSNGAQSIAKSAHYLYSNQRSKEKIGHYLWIANIYRIQQCKCFLYQCSNLSYKNAA